MRIVIAEDRALLREGLARLFEDGGHQVVATLGDAEQLLPVIEDPDLVVLDIRMPPTFTDKAPARPGRSNTNMLTSARSTVRRRYRPYRRSRSWRIRSDHSSS